MKNKIAIIGAGNLGKSIADGLLVSGIVNVSDIILTRRNTNKIQEYAEKGVRITSDNVLATKESNIILVCVEPHQFSAVLTEIKTALTADKILISTVTGYNLNSISKIIKQDISIYRAMPNTAISIRESMTCISSKKEKDTNTNTVQNLFNQLGKSVLINDELMGSATVLAASGIAFALRYIRASMQAGIEIGFNSELAQLIAAQTVKGASSLVLQEKSHPESEVDKVTTPLGITITGLNKMEYNGFSSSIIQGVLGSFEKIKKGK